MTRVALFGCFISTISARSLTNSDMHHSGDWIALTGIVRNARLARGRANDISRLATNNYNHGNKQNFILFSNRIVEKTLLFLATYIS